MIVLLNYSDFAELFGRIQNSVMPGDFCGDSFAQSDVEIILISDQVETEVKKLYVKIISLQSDRSGGSGQQLREILLLYANLRTELDRVVRKLSSVETSEGGGGGDTREQKRIVTAGLSVSSGRLSRASQRCSQTCSSASCRSCGLSVIQAVGDILGHFNRRFSSQGEEQPPDIKQEQRTGLLNIVGLYNELSRKILNYFN